MANALDENTMNCSWLTASTAGTESTANTTSVASTRRSTAKSGVARRRPSIRVNSLAPSYSGVDGTTRRTNFKRRLFSGSTTWSWELTSFQAV